MKKYLSMVLIIAFSFISLACKDSSTGISSNKLTEPNWALIANVVWNLNEAKVGNNVLDLSKYKPFKFAIGDTSIFGDDGCNKYNGKTKIYKDSIQIYSVGKTLKACLSELLDFNACLLLGSWKVLCLDSLLLLEKNDTIFSFKSNFIEPIYNKPFVNKLWSLSSSNDTSFTMLQQYDLLPNLYFNVNREFSINWYFAPRNPIFNSNFVGGVFGIKNDMLITFYEIRLNYASPQIPGVSIGLNDIRLVKRMISCESYTYTDTTFTLIKQPEQLYYNFTLTKLNSITKASLNSDSHLNLR